VIPSAAIADFLASEPADGDIIRRGWVGAALQPVRIRSALRRIAGQTTGRLVIDLTPDGPADHAGILPGDILLSVDGQPLHGRGSLRSLLGGSIGRNVVIRLARHGQIRTQQLLVAAQPTL
jgi:S1-C subfamily serine protease